MAYDLELADRIRRHLAGAPALTEKKMFGGLCFMVNGHMVCGPVKEGLMVRVGPDGYDEALAQPNARPMAFTGRTMRGFVEIDAADLEDDAVLADWVDRGVAHALSLPPKASAATIG